MASVTGSAPWLGSANPFPSAAFAHISDLRPEVPTIRTKAIQKIDGLVDDYLSATQMTGMVDKTRSGSVLADAGKVIVIKGDYGTGKTHLAIEILDRIRLRGSRVAGYPDTRTIYHVAPGGTFLTLYTDLMHKAITLDEVLGRVVEFYADVVADMLRERPFAGELVRLLEGGDADPQLVIERFGLKEGSLRQELRQRLSSVTGDEAFSKALMLLLQPALRDIVWRWLGGGRPEQVLIEQGITERIQTDESALEALGVMALLYGRKGRRFVLIIDELEKLVLTWERSPDASIQAFKKLLEVFKIAGAMLVCCGLPDMFEVLPSDPGRIDAIIEPSSLDDLDVRWYIEEVQGRLSGRRELLPFTDDVISHIVSLSGGIAREIVRFCYFAYERASATGHEITYSTIMSVAQNFPSGGGIERVRNEIGRILADGGWKSDRHRVLGESAGTRVDFWLPVGEDGQGCAIIISETVLDEQHVEQLNSQLSDIRAAAPGCEVILVVSGYLARNFWQVLADMFGGNALIAYDARRFDDDLAQAVSAAIGRIEPAQAVTSPAAPGASEFQVLREETERINRQQTNTLRLVRELASQVLAVGVASDERLDGIQRALEAAPGLPVTGRAAPADALPPVLEELFEAARRCLAAYGDVRKLMDDTFRSAAEEPGAGARLSLTYRLRGSEVFAPVGVAAFLSDLLASFRESIQVWLGGLGHSQDEVLKKHDRDRLRETCRIYDALYGVTPVFQLDPLPDLIGPASDGERQLSLSGRSTRRESLQEAMDGLGDRVYQVAIELAGGTIDPPHQVAN